MATTARKEGDTKPIRAKLRMSSGKAIPLTQATVKMLAVPQIEGVGAPLTKECVILDAATGKIEVPLEADELPTGANGETTYDVEFEITFSDGTIETVPNVGWERLVIYPDNN
jgi:hypothetical protein